MDKALLKTTEKVLGKYKLPSAALGKLWDNMRESKSGIDKLLGLDESNLYRAVLPLEKTEQDIRKDYPKTYSVVAHLLHQAVQEGTQLDLATISLVKNEILLKGQQGKVSKIISKQLDKQESIIDHCATELGIDKPGQFLPRLGDIVKTGNRLVISTNLLDFLMASDNCAYTSCHQIGHGSFNGNIAYARDAITLISFVINSKAAPLDHELYKVGRTWMTLIDKILIQSKSYGSYFDFERETARNFVNAKIAEKYGLPNEFKTDYCAKLPEENFIFEPAADDKKAKAVMWFDNYGLDISHPADERFKAPILNFSAAMCLECGDTTSQKDYGTCAEHKGHARGNCCTCGTRHNLDYLTEVRGELYCQDCMEELFFRCDKCGKYHPKGEREMVTGSALCKACIDQYTGICQCCDKRVFSSQTKELKTLNGAIKACTECAAKYALCSICKMHHKTEQVTYHKFVGRVCDNCAEENSFLCPSCGERHFKDKMVVFDGVNMCKYCEAKALGQDADPKLKPKYEGLPEGWDDFTEVIG